MQIGDLVEAVQEISECDERGEVVRVVAGAGEVGVVLDVGPEGLVVRFERGGIDVEVSEVRRVRAAA